MAWLVVGAQVGADVELVVRAELRLEKVGTEVGGAPVGLVVEADVGEPEHKDQLKKKIRTLKLVPNQTNLNAFGVHDNFQEETRLDWKLRPRVDSRSGRWLGLKLASGSKLGRWSGSMADTVAHFHQACLEVRWGHLCFCTCCMN